MPSARPRIALPRATRLAARAALLAAVLALALLLVGPLTGAAQESGQPAAPGEAPTPPPTPPVNSPPAPAEAAPGSLPAPLAPPPLPLASPMPSPAPDAATSPAAPPGPTERTDPAAPAVGADPAPPAEGADPTSPAAPSPTPMRAAPLPSRDWRAPGFVSVVDGQLFDPFCRPLRSAGSNVPNLLFRQGLRENLEWMRQHKIRWLRVIATGHGQPQRPADAAPGAVERRLADLLREVEAFNAAHPPPEAIYVLVSLTDYYEPGVPGDQYGYDHPGWCNARVLNAPWYRRGHPRYTFEQECGAGRLVDAPNYEVHYKPWVERLVAVGARSPALLGWQLGNETKARSSQRNGIDDAYTWYVEWTADMTDTIRRIDRNHLVFAGAQYLAELTDWPYRPRDGALDAGLAARYDALFERILRGCGQFCWNVWSLTNYDFRHYAIDDAMHLHRLGVAAVMTEYGFTLGSPDEERERFGGDRREAHRAGRPRPWQDLSGRWHPRDWGTLELVEQAGLQGIAPWGSPAPDVSASPFLDLDWQRGISLVHEGDELWQVWREIAGRLEAANEQRGISAACAAYASE